MLLAKRNWSRTDILFLSNRELLILPRDSLLPPLFWGIILMIGSRGSIIFSSANSLFHAPKRLPRSDTGIISTIFTAQKILDPTLVKVLCLCGVNWLSDFGNVNYKNGGPIAIADFDKGVERLGPLRTAGRAVVLMCGCPAVNVCHRKVLAERLAERWGAEVEHVAPPPKPAKPEPSGPPKLF